jgi:hypothetical protein
MVTRVIVECDGCRTTAEAPYTELWTTSLPQGWVAVSGTVQIVGLSRFQRTIRWTLCPACCRGQAILADLLHMPSGVIGPSERRGA